MMDRYPALQKLRDTFGPDGKGDTLRVGVRAAATSVAATAAVWLFGAPGVLWTVFLTAFAGVFVGERLAKSSLRSTFLFGVLIMGTIALLGIAGFARNSGALASIIGPGGALGLSLALGYGAFTFGTVTSLRAATCRTRMAAPLEIAVVTLGLTILFAAHRDGVIARPLWLSDWAWQNGFDPTQVLLAIGGAAIVVLIGLMVAESRDRVALATVIAMPLLAIVAAMSFSVTGLPEPQSGDNLGLTASEAGDTPNLDDEGQESPQGGSGDEQAEGQEGQDPEDGPPMDGDPQFDSPPPDSGDPAPLAVVIFGDDYSPPTHAYYFRQESWSEYNGRRLIVPRDNRIDRDIIGRYATSPTRVNEIPEETFRQSVITDVAMLVEHTAPFGLESPVLFEPMQNPDTNRFVRAYRVESLALTASWEEMFGRTSGAGWEQEVFDFYTEGPDDPRYLEFAEDLLAEIAPGVRNDPFMTALALKYAMDEIFIYSTQHRHAGSIDPTADFLFGDLTGYCVHFAHAAVYLYRALGIPARVGSGYYAPESARRGSTLVLTSSGAHAWPEVYIDGVGWVVVDLSPEQVLDTPPAPVDDELVEMLGELARLEPPDPAMDQDRTMQKDWSGAIRIIGLSLLLLVLLVLYGIKVWRRAATRFATDATRHRVVYRLTLDWLSESGLHRNYGESREQFATRVAAHAPAFRDVTNLHLQAALGDPSQSAGARSESNWSAAIDALRTQLPNVAPKRRRVLGLLNPISFLRSR